MRFSNWLWPTGKHGTPVDQDGFGQSLLDDFRYAVRFRAAKRRAVAWRTPDDAECAHFAAHPLVGRFGDGTIAVATVDGRTWIVRERDWYGWPDPPQFVFFALEPGGSVWSARDFHEWPKAWTRP
jgi:hypothetical protein